jgi:hypothetical protein
MKRTRAAVAALLAGTIDGRRVTGMLDGLDVLVEQLEIRVWRIVVSIPTCPVRMALRWRLWSGTRVRGAPSDVWRFLERSDDHARMLALPLLVLDAWPDRLVVVLQDPPDLALAVRATVDYARTIGKAADAADAGARRAKESPYRGELIDEGARGELARRRGEEMATLEREMRARRGNDREPGSARTLLLPSRR